jgi:hypothetical protein
MNSKLRRVVIYTVVGVLWLAICLQTPWWTQLGLIVIGAHFDIKLREKDA